jgi:O-succinylbenzoic acid--CoA ligase
VRGIHFGHQFISYPEILHADFTTEISQFQEAFDFCKDYLSGNTDFLVMTSGSTGPPKTITLIRNQLRSSACATIEALGLESKHKALVCISTEHIGGKMMLVRGMELEMEVFIREPKAEPDIAGLPQIDFVALVPLQLHHLIHSREGRNFINSCKVTIIGGARLDPAMEQELDQFENPIYHTFGMTETASHFALRRLNGTEKQQNYPVLKGVHTSKDVRGCLTVKGDITNNISLTTNDLIDFIDNNEFRWLGRWDRVINTGGFKVHPELLEGPVRNILRSLNIHDDHMLVGLPHALWGEQVTLILEMDPLNVERETRLQQLLKAALQSYEVPKAFRYLNPIPRTPTGKADFQELKKIFKAR